MIPRCYVFLDDPSVLVTRLAEVAHVVAETLGRSYPDVLGRIRYGRGVLVRDANPAEARLVGRALARLGMGVFSVPERDLEPAPRRAKRISKVGVDAEGLSLSIRGLEHIPPVRLEWAEVWGIAPHGLLMGSGSEERSGLPRRGATMAALSKPAAQLLSDLRRYRESERRPVRLCLDVLAAGSNLYRIHHDDAGVYAGIEARSEHAVENFLTLCGAMIEAAPSEVLIPDAVRRFLHSGEIEPVLFAKREALDSALLWMVQAHAYGVSYGDEVEDLDDDELTAEDEAILVEAEGDDAEDLEDDELEDDEPGDDFDSRDELEEDSRDDLVEVGSPVGSAGDAELLAGPGPDALEDGDLEDGDLEDGDLEDGDLEDGDLEGDADVSAALEHFEQSTRLDQAAIEAMLSQSRDLEEEDDDLDLSDEGLEVDGEIQNTLGLFEAASGPIDVRQLLNTDEDNTPGE